MSLSWNDEKHDNHGLEPLSKYKHTQTYGKDIQLETNVDDEFAQKINDASNWQPPEPKPYNPVLESYGQRVPQKENSAPLGMAWYKFLIYFGLIAGAIINIIYGINYISGDIYFVLTNGEVSASQVYTYCGTYLQFVDILYGFFLMSFAILAFVVRDKLAKYKPDALKFVKVFYTLAAGVPFLYAVLVSVITRQSLAAQSVISEIVALIILFLNIKYFKKRAHLFMSKAVSVQTPSKGIQNNQHTDNNLSSVAASPATSPIEELALLTAMLPLFVAEKSQEKPIFVKNDYTYCDAVIFAEFFIRANALEIAPSQDIAIKFSDKYITAVTNSVIDLLPEASSFFVDMFYSRATLYDNIVLNSTSPTQEVVELLAHIIHKESDENKYIDVADKNFKHFGGIFENLTIMTELVALFEHLHSCTKKTMDELKEYLKSM